MAEKRKGEGQRVLVTGASGGIGLELVRCFAADGYDVALAARSGEKLKSLATELGEKYHVAVAAFPCDLGRIGAGAELVKALDDRGLAVDVLVNNAGYATGGVFAEADPADELGMIDLDIRALVELTRLLMPRMLKNRRGGVLNVGSTAAFQPGPTMAVYCAAKAFVKSFSEALWEETRGTGVTVSCLCPGATATGFAHRAGVENVKLFRSGMMTPDRVARLGYEAFQANRRVEVTGIMNKLMAGSVAFAPRQMALRIARSMLSA